MFLLSYAFIFVGSCVSQRSKIKNFCCWKAITEGKATRQKVSHKPGSYLKYLIDAISETGTGKYTVYVLHEKNIQEVRKQ